MQINVLLPSGTRTVDLDELKELVRQGVVQPSTLLETGGQRGKAKNVPALKPIFAELVAAQAEAPEPSTFPTSPTPPEPPVFPSNPTPPEPPVFFADFDAARTAAVRRAVDVPRFFNVRNAATRAVVRRRLRSRRLRRPERVRNGNAEPGRRAVGRRRLFRRRLELAVLFRRALADSASETFSEVEQGFLRRQFESASQRRTRALGRLGTRVPPRFRRFVCRRGRCLSPYLDGKRR